MTARTGWGPAVFTLAIAIVIAPFVFKLLTVVPSQEAQPVVPDQEEPAAQVRAPLPQELHSRWYTQTVAPVIPAGGTAHVTLQFRNVGHTAWIKGTAAEIRLGEIGPRPLPPEMRLEWPYPNRPAVQDERIVHEQQLVTFTFQVKGEAPGTYRLRLRPVVDGIAWLEDEGVFVDITVVPR
jgi:hypothetical protein